MFPFWHVKLFKRLLKTFKKYSSHPDSNMKRDSPIAFHSPHLSSLLLILSEKFPVRYAFFKFFLMSYWFEIVKHNINYLNFGWFNQYFSLWNDFFFFFFTYHACRKTLRKMNFHQVFSKFLIYLCFTSPHPSFQLTVKFLDH